MSKVPCKEWKVLNIKENNVEFLCDEYADGDGEILDLSKENISCRVSDCLEDSQDWVPLSSLKDCPPPAPASESDKENLMSGCVLSSPPQEETTVLPDDQATLLPDEMKEQ